MSVSNVYILLKSTHGFVLCSDTWWFRHGIGGVDKTKQMMMLGWMLDVRAGKRFLERWTERLTWTSVICVTNADCVSQQDKTIKSILQNHETRTLTTYHHHKENSFFARPRKLLLERTRYFGTSRVAVESLCWAMGIDRRQ